MELYKFDFSGTVDYFEKLEVIQALEAKHCKVEMTNNSEYEKKGNRNKSEDKTVTSKSQSARYKKHTAVIQIMRQKNVGLVLKIKENQTL